MRFPLLSLLSLLSLVALIGVGVSALTANEGISRGASDMFSLKRWKLIIPLDDDGDGIADEVTQPSLRRFEDPDFFYLSDTADSVVFRAQTSGVAPDGETAPRSQLVEMNSKRTELASWSTTSGVHNLTVEFSINALPADETGVTALQIHDGEAGLINVRLVGKRLFLERKGDEDFVLADDYELGSFLQLMLISDHGRVRALVNTRQVMEWKVEADGLYYTIGALVAPAPSEDAEDTVAEVEFREVYVVHK